MSLSRSSLRENVLSPSIIPSMLPRATERSEFDITNLSYCWDFSVLVVNRHSYRNSCRVSSYYSSRNAIVPFFALINNQRFVNVLESYFANLLIRNKNRSGNKVLFRFPNNNYFFVRINLVSYFFPNITFEWTKTK